jgi:uncharacterized membrane protein YkoI
MISNRTKLAIGVAVIALAGGGGAYAWAGAGDDEGGATGPGADRARQAALAHLGGGTANSVERDNEKGATWEVEVTKSNGSTVDVRLDAAYKVVAVDGDSESGDDNESDDRGGEGGATGPGADRAREAALAHVGGGTANAVERDNENGATWEVEVTKSDGSTVDVDLDAAYKVVAFDSDSESGDDSESDNDNENEGLEQGED